MIFGFACDDEPFHTSEADDALLKGLTKGEFEGSGAGWEGVGSEGWEGAETMFPVSGATCEEDAWGSVAIGRTGASAIRIA